MGLDMHLTKQTYVRNWEFTKPEDRYEITVLRGGKPVPHIRSERIKGITEEVGYWRKANQIHRWFVDNVQDGTDDCKECYVSREQLKELLDTCKKVKASIRLVKGDVVTGYRSSQGGGMEPIIERGKLIKDPSVAKELLPSESGFFFGSTDYDQWYAGDIDNTITILEQALAEDGDIDFYYQSSW